MLQLAAVFSDHMVLQREKNIVVFGIGEVGAIITVSIPERKLYASTTVKEDGSWRLQFPPQPAGTGLSLFAKDSHTEIHFQDVAIGEVWLAGGQSNMEFPVKNAVNGKLELSRCERSRVRYYHVQRSGVMHAAYFQNERKTAGRCQIQPMLRNGLPWHTLPQRNFHRNWVSLLGSLAATILALLPAAGYRLPT